MQKRGPQSGGRRRAKRPITAPLSWERRETASDPCSEASGLRLLVECLFYSLFSVAALLSDKPVRVAAVSLSTRANSLTDKVARKLNHGGRAAWACNHRASAQA